jgi:ribonuclease D
VCREGAHDPPTHRRTDAQQPVTTCSNEDAHPPTPDEQLDRLTKNENDLGMGNGQVAQGAHPVEHFDYMPVFKPADLADLVEEISHTTGPIALDMETFDPTGEDRALDVRRARVRLLQLTVGESSAPYVVDARTAGDIGPLLGALADRSVVIHNAAYDLAVLRTNYGYVHRGPVFDTFLAAKAFYAGTNNRAGLEDLLAGLLEVEIDKTNQDSDWGADLSPAQLEYAARDVLYLHELADVLRSRTNKAGLGNVVALENRMVKVTAEMTTLGMPVDEAVFAECVRESVESVERTIATLDSLVTEPLPEKFASSNAKNKNVPKERTNLVNWNSTPQILWAFRTAGLKLRSTDKQTRAKHEGYPMVDALSALRNGGDIARRFKETEVADGRMHATWKQVEAATGRMACENPPLQGISKLLRRAFVAPAGHDLVISDLSQIEVRVLCAISGGDNLRQEFIARADVTRTAITGVGCSQNCVRYHRRAGWHCAPRPWPAGKARLRRTRALLAARGGTEPLQRRAREGLVRVECSNSAGDGGRGTGALRRRNRGAARLDVGASGEPAVKVGSARETTTQPEFFLPSGCVEESRYSSSSRPSMTPLQRGFTEVKLRKEGFEAPESKKSVDHHVGREM